jgi:hypothetical protein
MLAVIGSSSQFGTFVPSDFAFYATIEEDAMIIYVYAMLQMNCLPNV